MARSRHHECHSRGFQGLAAQRCLNIDRVPLVILSLFHPSLLPAVLCIYLRFLEVDPFERRRYIPYRSEQPERLSQGTEVGTPGKAVRPTGRTWSYGWEGQLAVRAGRLGRPQSPTKGSTARKPRQLPEVARST